MSSASTTSDPGGKSPWRDAARWKAIGKEGAGLGLAEFVSGTVSLGVVAVADQVSSAVAHLTGVDVLKEASKAVGKMLVPHLEKIEHGLGTVCKLEECKPDKTLSREQRAENLAHTLVVFGAAWAGSMVAKMGTRQISNHLMGLTPKKRPLTGNWFQDHIVTKLPKAHDWKVIAWDEGVHIGSMLVMNTALAKQTDEAIATTTNILQKTMGWSEKKAHEVASMGIIWEVPNFVGWLAGLGHITHHHMTRPAAAL